MPYIQRDGSSNIVALYGLRQTGFGEEFLPDTDPAVIAFRNPPDTFGDQLKVDTAAVKAQAPLVALINATPAQIDNYMDANVTDVASARAVLKLLAKALSVVARRTLR